MYTARCLNSGPDLENDPSRKGFITPKNAWDWIKANHLCGDCIKELETGYAILTGGEDLKDLPIDGYEETKMLPVESPSDTMCGANWSVDLTQSFDEDIKSI